MGKGKAGKKGKGKKVKGKAGVPVVISFETGSYAGVVEGRGVINPVEPTLVELADGTSAPEEFTVEQQLAEREEQREFEARLMLALHNPSTCQAVRNYLKGQPQ